ncbi:hypothetical protein LTR70_006146 [Exophiala xenobiotica]|uniref:Uncharacterized protein n=1 Tax=Lithohypha guttulata TaxID=1690604 RepID=A0ABR0K8A2_9EURO|nr:hypothetical protein LTR24_005617 [Lithohypha guttulata]KAK5316899.1 hypothetical protein LTR70_006146 [Exophiala xenobiotica]
MARHLHGRAARHLCNCLYRPSIATSSSSPNSTSCIGTRYLSSQPSNSRIPNFAFAFDIDGVLLRSSTPIPGASQCLSYLRKHHIPFILLTNGGGKTEAERTRDLNNKLSLPPSHQIHVSQLIQSHTPLSELATTHGTPSYKDKTILVCGGDGGACRLVAEHYGFTNVVTPGDIIAAYADIWPFSSNFAAYYSTFARPLPRPINLQAADPETESLKIDAVMVFNDPRDWGLDCQLLLDIMLSHKGIVGTYSARNGKKELPNHGYQSDGQPEIYFSNPDLLWASAYPLSRLGQGGFREAFLGVWKAVTRNATGEEVELKYNVMGKPHQPTYEYAEKLMVQSRKEAFGDDVQDRVPLEKVYMIGDNPESDIAGANNYKSLVGAQWTSVLTRTGVFRAAEGETPTVEPKIVVDDVRVGVEWALRDAEWDDVDLAAVRLEEAEAKKVSISAERAAALAQLSNDELRGALSDAARTKEHEQTG